VETLYNRPGVLGQAKPQGTLLVRAGVRGWKKRMPPCNGADTGCNITRPERELTSYAGAPLRERLENLLREGKQMAAVERFAGAPSSKGNRWKAINWHKARREVRRLQIRIAKAVREGRHGRVKALQWLLTRSFSGKALAVKRVVSNRGRKTPGVDGVI
jgi:hypothetical protein